jgi:hypothetical protein
VSLKIIFDTPGAEVQPWAIQVASGLKLALVDNDRLAKEMAQNETARKALLSCASGPVKHTAELAPFYRAALERSHSGAPRLALWGTAWLLSVSPVNAVVVDWSFVEAQARQPGISSADGSGFREVARTFVQERLARFHPKGHVLELPADASTAERADASRAFLSKLGLVKG